MTALVPFNGLKAQYHRLRTSIDAAVARVLESGHYVGGPEVERFEQSFAKYVGIDHAVAVANGTDAIALGLRALNVGEGDEVLVPALSAYPTTVGVVESGARPVFVDVNPRSGLLEIDSLEEVVSPATKAVVPVHLYGNLPAAVDHERLLAVARKFNLKVVEDCAQAAGSRGTKHGPGLSGVVAAWSFYPTKNLGAYGDAGAVTTNSEELSERLRLLRNYGQRNRYEHPLMGSNSRLDPLQAAILDVKIRYLDEENAARRRIAEMYDQAFQHLEWVRLVDQGENVQANRHLYPVLLAGPDERTAFQQSLESSGIETLVHYPIPMSDQEATPKAYRRACPNARAFCSRVVSLPMYPDLTAEQCYQVINAVVSWDRNRNGPKPV